MFSHSIWFKQLNHWNRFNQPNQSKPSNALNQSAALAGACLCHWSCAAALCAALVAELIGLIRLNRLNESNTVRTYTYMYIYIYNGREIERHNKPDGSMTNVSSCDSSTRHRRVLHSVRFSWLVGR